MTVKEYFDSLNADIEYDVADDAYARLQQKIDDLSVKMQAAKDRVWELDDVVQTYIEQRMDEKNGVIILLGNLDLVKTVKDIELRGYMIDTNISFDEIHDDEYEKIEDMLQFEVSDDEFLAFVAAVRCRDFYYNIWADLCDEIEKKVLIC